MLVNTVGPPDAKIFFVGEAPGKEEDETGKPFVGAAGRTLNQLLSQAGIPRYQCLVGNVAKERPPANKISFYFEDKKCTIPKPKMEKWVDELKNEIQLYNPNIIVALGNTALWALTGEKKISDFRGYILPCSLVPGKKVLATYHPQAVNHEWKLFFQVVLDLRKALRHSEAPEINYTNVEVRPGLSPREFISYMEELIEDDSITTISLDVETVQPGSHIEEFGIAHSPYFGASCYLLKGRIPTMPENDEVRFWQTVAKLVDCKQVIMQNAAYDIGVLWYNQHILVKNLVMDTLIAAHVCFPELPRDLGFLGSICLDVPPWKSGSAKTVDYNPLDAANTFGIALALDKELDKQNVRHTFDYEMSLIPISLMMQLQGISVDETVRKELVEKWKEERANLKQQLFKVIGREINFNSSKQMQQLLYFDLKLPIQYKRRKSITEKRTMTSDANALRTLSRLVPDNPVFNLILDYKKADTLLRFLEVEVSPEGKVHTSYNITGASSDDEEDTKKTKRSFGRWSSSASIILPYGSGNLQNIPPEARKIYRAKEGYKIIEADYSQAEAVVVSHLTSDNKLKKMFKEAYGLSLSERTELGYDIHKLTYADMAQIPFDQVTKKQRTDGKTVRHATSYSAGPLVLANRLGIKLSEAKKLMEMYHKAKPELRIWYGHIQEELKKTRTLTNLLGRKHKFLDAWGDSLFRSAYSFKPQGTVGDLLNMALKRLYDAQLEIPWEIEILLQLHDAIYVQVKDEDIKRTIRLMRNCMRIPLEYNNEVFYIDCDFKVKTSWAEGVDVEVNWRDDNGENMRW